MDFLFLADLRTVAAVSVFLLLLLYVVVREMIRGLRGK